MQYVLRSQPVAAVCAPPKPRDGLVGSCVQHFIAQHFAIYLARHIREQINPSRRTKIVVGLDSTDVRSKGADTQGEFLRCGVAA